MKSKLENLFILGYGLAGGFGGIQYYIVAEAKDLADAEDQAYSLACEYYDGYAGSNGLRDTAEIMEEDGIETEDEAQQVYNDERESWLDYTAEPYTKEAAEKAKGYHFQNDYKEVTE
jgi:hypothetical protein